MEKDREKRRIRHVAVIGGGASGALSAIQLLRRMAVGDRVTLIERNADVGLGVAYGTTDTSHLLNVRAINLSLFPDDVGHFSRWLVAKGLAAPHKVDDAYFPRMYFGQYLVDTLECERRNSSAELCILKETALAFLDAEDQLCVLTSGSTVTAEAYVLALGHLPPKIPASLEAVASEPRFIVNPWQSGVLGAIGPDDAVFIVGTGLTMVDQVMALVNAGHRGRIVARSRRGLMPRVHRLNTPAPFQLADFERPDLFRFVIRTIRESGDNWRSVIDGIRPFTPRIWAALSLRDKKRFLRRLAPYWDVHRHRVPRPAYEILQSLIAAGRLNVGAGQIANVGWDGSRFQIQTRTGPETADWIINCTGPDCDWLGAKNPLMESGKSLGLLDYDDLGMGVRVDEDGRTDAAGRVWALGPICRGTRWESMAMPEIRAQALKLAECLI